jgi:hypothetical protein
VTAPSGAPPSSSNELASPTFVAKLRWWWHVRRAYLLRMLATAILALAIGVVIGRVTAPASTSEVHRTVETSLLPLVLDADGIWTSSAADRPPVSEALVGLQRDGDPTLVLDFEDAWLTAYDAVLVRLAGVELPPEARPVQRQFISAVTLSRDAVEVLARAAEIEDPDRRRGLLTEVGRLRLRGEQLTQAGRASTLDLGGRSGDVSPLPEVIPFPDVEE